MIVVETDGSVLEDLMVEGAQADAVVRGIGSSGDVSADVRRFKASRDELFVEAGWAVVGGLGGRGRYGIVVAGCIQCARETRAPAGSASGFAVASNKEMLVTA